VTSFTPTLIELRDKQTETTCLETSPSFCALHKAMWCSSVWSLVTRLQTSVSQADH